MATPLTPPSLNTYELYKNATNEVVSWLVQAGASCGYGNPKSKSQFSNRYLQKCAEAISRKPTIEIPGRIIDTTDDMIIGRQLFVAWFGGQSTSDQESNGTHQHFLATMQDIRQLLVQARRERKPQSEKSRASTLPAKADVSAPEKALSNLFQHLRLEEPCRNANKSQDSSSVKPVPAAAKSTTLLVEVDPDEDKRFAIFCYLQDQLAIRAFVRETWEQFARGEISLFVATTVVEEAYACMLRAEVSLPAFNDLIKFLHIEAQYEESHDKITVSFVDINTRETSTLSESLCPTAYVFLTGLMHEWSAWHDQLKDKRCDEYLPDPAAIDFAAKTHPLLQRLLNIVPELCLATHHRDDDGPNTRNMGRNYQTELIRSLFLVQEAGHVLTGPVMLLQSYMDMFDVLGDRPDFAVQEYIDTVEQTKEAFVKIRKFKESHPVDTIMNEEAEPYMPYMADFVEEEVDFKTALLLHKELSAIVHNSAIARHVRIAHVLPTALGVRVSLLKRRMHDFEYRFANDGVIMPAMAYLYRAARWYGKVSLWPDFERLIELQTKASGQSFVKDIPEHADAVYYTQHVKMFCFGASAQSKNGNISITLDRITKICSDVEWTQLLLKHQKSPFFGVDVVPGGDKVDRETRDRTVQAVLQDIARSSQGPSKHKTIFTPLECLQALKQAWIRDEPEINFSYLGLWMPLTEILSNLRKIIAKNPTEHVYPKGSKFLFESIPGVMTEAYITYRLEKHNKNDELMKRARLLTAAFMMEKVIKSSGDRYSMQSEERSGGRVIEAVQTLDFESPHQSSDIALTVKVPDAEERERFREWLQAPFPRR